MDVPPALFTHESTEYYTPQYILDVVIACMGATDPGLYTRQKPGRHLFIPNRD
jgi:hypothetical protein